MAKIVIHVWNGGLSEEEADQIADGFRRACYEYARNRLDVLVIFPEGMANPGDTTLVEVKCHFILPFTELERALHDACVAETKSVFNNTGRDVIIELEFIQEN